MVYLIHLESKSTLKISLLSFTGSGLTKMMEEPSDTEEERAALASIHSSGDSLKEAKIKMTARQVLDTCRGTSTMEFFHISRAFL